MGKLTLNLLGPPTISHAGKKISLSTSKTLALLVYLAVEEGMHRRDRLATLFWPESDSGRVTLRSTLRYLRDGLAHDDEGSTAPHLNVERGALGFNRESMFELDLDALEAAAVGKELEALRQAADLCRGEFLEGFSLPDAPAFDEWATFQREYWHRRANEVFERLSSLQIDSGEMGTATKTVTRWLKLAPLQESGYRRLMRLHFMSGDRAAALRVYGQYSQLLGEELALEPAPETTALAERIRREQPPQRAAQPAQSTMISPGELPLVGREEAYRQLTGLYDAVRDGGFRAAVLEGQAGIGKTRLAHDFLVWVQGHGGGTAAGRAFAMDRGLPYQPVVTVLQEALANRRREEINLSPRWLAELSRLLPELHEQYPDLPAPQDDESTAQTRLFEAVAQLGSGLSTRRPLVWFVDDGQWADSASLDLLGYAARRWADIGAPILLLISIRSEALMRSNPAGKPKLRDWLTELRRDVPMTCRLLRLLSEADTCQLVKTLVTDLPSEELGQWLHTQTQGHPLFIAETLKALQEEGLMPDETSGPSWQPPSDWIAPGVREVIRSRLERLPDHTRDALAAAAVLDHGFTFNILRAVAGSDGMETLAALDQLQASYILIGMPEAAPSGHSRYHFTHDHIRTVVYDYLPDAQRQYLHERAFEHLQETGMTAAARLAHHARAAGRWEAAFKYDMTAGNDALRVFAVQEAIDYYVAAHELLESTPLLAQYTPPEARRRLYERLGRACELVNAWEQARTAYTELLAFAQTVDDASLEIAARSHLASLAIKESVDVAAAIDQLEQAEALAERSGDREGLAQVQWSLSHTTYYAFDRARAIKHGEQALALAERIENKQLSARCLNALAYAKTGAVSLAMLDKAVGHAEAAADRFAELNDRAMQADSLNVAASAHLHAGRAGHALPLARQARDMTREIKNMWGMANTGFTLAVALFETGDPGAALAAVDEAAALCHERNLQPLTAGVLTVRGAMYRALLCPERALVDHKAAYAFFSGTQNPPIARAMALELGTDHAVAGAWEAALDPAQEGLPLPGRSWLYGLMDYWWFVEALLRGGAVEQARQAVEEFGERIAGNPRYAIPYQHALALLAHYDSGEKAAIPHLETAAAAAEALDVSVAGWQALAALGRCYAQLGQEEEAEAIRRRAWEAVETLAGTLAAEIREQFVTGAQARIRG